jgi:hypothetical protein
MKQVLGIPHALGVCGLLLVACGGGLSREDYAETYGEALCHRQKRCGEIRDEDACVRHAREFARAQRAAGLTPYSMYEGSFRSGRLRFDEDATQACVRRIRDSSCEESLGQARDGDVCEVLEGQRKNGEDCLVTEECGRASYCELPEQAVCVAGTCLPRPTLGQTVIGWKQECAPGLVQVDTTCQAISGEGESCEGDFMCTPGLYCGGSPGVCRRFAVEGEACGAAGLAACLPHLRCSDGSCQRLFDVGRACIPSTFDSGGSDTSNCKRDLFCEGDARSGMGTCRERLGLGEACSGNTCRTLLACDWPDQGNEGTCQPFREPGEPCGSVPCVPGAYCEQYSLICVHQGRLGEPCTSSSFTSCIAGLSCVHDTCQPAFGGTCGGK